MTSTFFWKWELQNEYIEGIRDKMLQGREISKEDLEGLEIFADSLVKGRQPSRSSNQKLYAPVADLSWNLGAHALLQQDEVKLLPDYLLRLAGIQTKLKEESLLELTLACMNAGLWKEALERLETYLPLIPYSENPKLFGYAGLIAYTLWKQDEQVIRYHRKAMDCFQNALRLNTHSSSYFLKYLVSLMSTSDRDRMELVYILEALTASVETSDHFCLLALYKLYRELDKPPDSWMPLAYQLCKTDPMGDVGILVDLAQQVYENRPAFKIPFDEMMDLLARRIEYEKTNLLVWRCLAQYNPILSPLQIQSVWQDRVKFWPEYLTTHEQPEEELRRLHKNWIDQVLAKFDLNIQQISTTPVL